MDDVPDMPRVNESEALYCGALNRQHKCCLQPGHSSPHQCMPLCSAKWANTTTTTDSTKDTE